MKNTSQPIYEKKKVIDLGTHIGVPYESGMSMDSILHILDLALFDEVSMKKILKENKLQLIEGKYLVTLDNKMPKVGQVIKFPKLVVPPKKFEKIQPEIAPEIKRNLLAEIQSYISDKVQDAIEYANEIDSKVYIYAIGGVIVLYVFLGGIFYFSYIENKSQENGGQKQEVVENTQQPTELLAKNEIPEEIISEIPYETISPIKKVKNKKDDKSTFTISSQGDVKDLKSVIDAWNNR